MDLGLCLFCVRHVLGYNGRDGIQGHVALAHASDIAVSNLGIFHILHLSKSDKRSPGSISPKYSICR